MNKKETMNTQTTTDIVSAPKPAPQLITPENSMIIFIDHSPQYLFSLSSMDRGTLINNAAGLAKTAKLFKIPVLLSSSSTEFSGPLIPQISSVFPNEQIIQRTTINGWEDKRIVEAVRAANRKKLIFAGLWTEVCVAFPALSAINEGYEVYAVTDASGGYTKESHNYGITRMVQAGVIPVTWLQVLFEYQRDWARTGTAGGVQDILKEHAGALGAGVFYAEKMIPPKPKDK